MVTFTQKMAEILLRDFKYDNNDQYSWINKVAPFKYINN